MSINAHRLPARGRAAVALWLACSAASTGTLAASGALPPGLDTVLQPGLYRIEGEVVGTFGTPTVNAQLKTDAGNGDAKAVWRNERGVVAERQYSGSGPRTVCIGGANAGPPPGATCPTQSNRTDDGTLHWTSQCNGMSIRGSAKRVSSDVWQFETRLVSSPTAAAGGPASLEAMRPLLEHTARNAATAQERAKAKEALEKLPQMQKEMAQRQAEMQAKLQEAERRATPEQAAQMKAMRERMGSGGMGGLMDGLSRERWTRIAASCSG